MAENRCLRCNRVISDPNAQYGWRCAEILGVSEDLNYAGDEAFRAFILGITEAENASRGKKLTETQKNMLYEATVKRYLSADMHNAELWKTAYRESIATHGTAKSKPLSEYIHLRDEFDYGNGTYTTTGYLDGEASEKTRELQHALNEIGIRDKFGNRLKEDGLYGPKTQWANDVLIKGPSHALKYDKTAFLGRHNLVLNKVESSKKGQIKPINKILFKSDAKDTKTKLLFHVDKHDLKNGIKQQPHINVDSLDDSLSHQKSIAQRLDHMEISESTYNIFKDFDSLEKLSKKGGKALSAVGYVFDAYEFGTAVYADLNDDDKKLGKITVNSAAGISGSWVGGAAGAKLGTMGGAAIGSLILPGLGTAIGGFIGGAVGGMVGSYAGRELGEHAVDAAYDMEELFYEKKKVQQ